MGMTLGGYPGNYYAATGGVSVSASRTVAQSLAAADKLGASWLPGPAAASALSLDVSSDSTPAAPFKTMLNELAAINGAGVGIFAGDGNYLLHRLLVLWADTLRRDYVRPYQPQRRRALPAHLCQRRLPAGCASTTAATGGQGDYMPAVAGPGAGQRLGRDPGDPAADGRHHPDRPRRRTGQGVQVGAR
jgi:hypothetical protein